MEYCTGSNDLIIYTIKGSPYESLSARLPLSDENYLTTEGSFSTALSSTNTFNYRTYNGDPSNIFCNSLPPTSPEITGNSEATNGTVNFSTTLEEDDNDGIPANLEDDNTDGDDDPSTNPTDTDGDGYPDWLEIAAGSDPALATSVPTDTDGDLVPDLVELMQGTDPALPLDYMDDDGDLVPNYIEAQDGTDATDPTVGGFVDTDGDLVPDYVEETRQVNAGGAATDSTLDTDLVDTDLGGVPDYVEETLFPNSGLAATDPLVLADDSQDTDAGGETDYDELLAGTDPLVKDGSEVPTSGGGGGTYIPRVCKDTTALNYKSYGISTPSKCEYAVVTATTTDTTTTVDNSGSLFDQLKALLVQVLAAKTAGTTVDVTSATCSLAITPTADIYLGSGADSQDIKLLQKYLNAFEGENLIADGTLRPADIAAVHRYQSKYPAEILTPWGLTSSTGRTFKTTVAHINSRLCNPETPLATAAPFFRVNMCNVYGSAVNLPHEVRLVQEFLNKVEGTTLRTDGVYDLATRDAIVAYQTKYNVVDPLAHAPGDMHDVTTAHMNAKIQEWIDAGKW